MKRTALLLTICSLLTVSCGTGTANRNNAGTRSVILPESFLSSSSTKKIDAGQFDVAQLDAAGQFDAGQLDAAEQFDVVRLDEGQFNVVQLDEGQFDAARPDDEQSDITQLDQRQFDVKQFAGGEAEIARLVDTENIIEIKEKMFIAQTNDIYLNPEDYMGKLIKLEGLYKSVQYDTAAVPYCFVLRYGPGCCGNDGSAGFEVAWENKAVPPPQEDDWVEAVGMLKFYEEDGYPYLYLSLASLTIKETRGAEFVSQ
jgi:hypothetical protein